MKKTLVYALVLVMAAASGAFAGTIAAGEEVHVNEASASNDDALVGKLSSGVSMGFAINANSYSIVTKHSKGDRQFGTAAGDTKLYSMTVEETAVVSEPDDSTSDYFTAEGWEPL